MQRPVDVDPELVDDVGGVLGRERHVLGGERIDRGRPDARGRQRRRRPGRTPAGGRSAASWRPIARQQEVEHLRIRRREVDVAAPDPVVGVVARVLDHPGRLRVVDDHEVVLALERLGVHRVVAPEDLLLLLGQPGRVALERVVNRLRDVEELVLAVDDLPLRVEPGVAHERHERVEDLRDAAAERGGREVQDALAGEGLRQRADLVHEAASGDRSVVPEMLRPDVDGL